MCRENESCASQATRYWSGEGPSEKSFRQSTRPRLLYGRQRLAYPVCEESEVQGPEGVAHAELPPFVGGRHFPDAYISLDDKRKLPGPCIDRVVVPRPGTAQFGRVLAVGMHLRKNSFERLTPAPPPAAPTPAPLMLLYFPVALLNACPVLTVLHTERLKSIIN